jgi:ribosomal protein S18 acetylase RimI-like enzyme
MSSQAHDLHQPNSPIGPENIGHRVSVRLHHPEGGFQDVVGILESETSIRKRDETVVTFNPRDVAVWRAIDTPIYPAGKGAPLSLRIREIEIAAAKTWPAANQETLGEWVLRATGKFTMRANSVLVLGEPDQSLDSAIARVISFYEAHSLPAVFHIPLPTYQDLDRYLEEKGWLLKTRALVMVADIDNPQLSERSNYSWTIAETFDDEWLQLQNDFGVSDIMKSAPATYASLKVDGALAAVGRAANFGDWTVLTRLFVHPDFRRQGIGTELISRLLHQAQNKGASKALLQVDEKNAPAIRAYEQYGFRTHHSYCYRVLSQKSATEC